MRNYKNALKHINKEELSTQKVELSLQQVEKIFNESKEQAKFRDKVEVKIEAAKKELKAYVDDANVIIKQIDDNMLALVKAGGEIDKIKKDVSGAGISTAPLDARLNEIKDMYNFLSKVRNDINRAVVTARNL
jgi:F0F1-type ATP synthase delta subunit